MEVVVGCIVVVVVVRTMGLPEDRIEEHNRELLVGVAGLMVYHSLGTGL